MGKTKFLFFQNKWGVSNSLEKDCGKGAKIQNASKSEEFFYLLFEDGKTMKIISEILPPLTGK